MAGAEQAIREQTLRALRDRLHPYHTALREARPVTMMDLDEAKSVTYTCCQGELVVSFYSLAVGSIDPEAAPSNVMKGLARHPVPVMIRARFAVDKAHQRKGLGQALLKGVLLRTAQAADIASIRCPLVHAKDDAARHGCIMGIRAQPERSVPPVPDAR